MGETWIVSVTGLLAALFGPVLVAVASEKSAQPDRLGPHLFAQAGLVAIVAVVLSIVFFWERESASSIGLKPVTLRSLAWGLALAAFFMYIFAPVSDRALRLLRLGGFDKGLRRLQRLPVWYLILAVVIGGVAEEILYRGYAVKRIAALTGSLWLAGSIPAVVFAVAHAPTWGWGAVLVTLVSGAIFTIFYLWQRDLVACIIAHVVTDFAGIVIGPVVARRRASRSRRGQGHR
jgi:membrane protease YdiL (CAAX protease family)